jgi:uncharacterized protein with HEPN domain
MSKKIAVIGECMIELSQKGAEVQPRIWWRYVEHIRLYRPSGRCLRHFP